MQYFCNLCREEIKDRNGFRVVFGSRNIQELQFQAFDNSDCHLCQECVGFFERMFTGKKKEAGFGEDPR